MRALFALLVVACAGGAPESAEPEEGSCTHYAQMNVDDAAREWNAELRDADRLGRELGALQEEGVPNEYPHSIAAGTALGETLARMLKICRCNEQLARTSDCALLEREIQRQLGP